MDYTKRSIKKDRRMVMQHPEWNRFVKVDLEKDEIYQRSHNKMSRSADMASPIVARILGLPESPYTCDIGIGAMNLYYCGNVMGMIRQ